MKRTRKKKSDTEIDRLNKEIRELKSTIRSLMKRLKKVDRDFDSESSEEKEVEELEVQRDKCPICSRGILVPVIITIRSSNKNLGKRCNVCEYKEKVNGKKS